MGIKAVAFDYGGVISLPQDGNTMRDLAFIAGIDSALMRRIYWENRQIYDRGLVNGKEYFKNILADVGIFPDDLALEKMVLTDVKSWSRINAETEQLMKDIKKAGLKVGILSNMVQPFLDTVRETIPVFLIPDESVYSCEVDTVKPERKIYELILSALGCKAGELVFFDDTGINVTAAAQLGIHAFLWRDAAAARRELELLCAGRL
ncbi:MAG: HAD family phosphatase [Treponema sp.]|jgi:putative hydrolase of the HAD superfamily|nr:HAD family phosphatase [Treponema sp.]